MVKYTDIINAVNELIKTKYPKIKRYGRETVDKAEPPYFFVELVPGSIIRESKNMFHNSCSVKITYNSRVHDDVDNLTKVQEIWELLGMTIKISGRKLLVLDYDHDYVGTNNNILQIGFRLDWYESTEYIEGDLIEHVSNEITVKGDN